jgi:uncharacterized protein YbdZ (MbtH family)
VFLLSKLGIFFIDAGVFYVAVTDGARYLAWAVLILIFSGWFLGCVPVSVRYCRNDVVFFSAVY